MNNAAYETDTHEERPLEAFRLGDHIVVNGDEKRVIFVGYPDGTGKMRIMWSDMSTGGFSGIYENLNTMFIARKRDYDAER